MRVYLPRIVYVPPGVQPPLAPSLMSITSPGANVSYRLSWTPIYGAEQYEVQQGTSPFFGPPIQQVYAGDHAFFDKPSSGIGTFYYRVRSINLAGVSAWSDAQSAYVSWESEPNNVLTEANSGIAPGQLVYALPDDPNDFFEVTTSQAGWVTAQVDNMVGQSVRLVLYRDNVGNVLASDTSAPYLVTGYGEPGNFYVRVFVGDGYSLVTPYRLSISYK
jgi:hypothetical protein